MNELYAKKVQAAVRGMLSRKKIVEQSPEMAERLRKMKEGERADLQKQVQDTYTTVHTLRFGREKEACYVTIQRWFRGILADRVARVGGYFVGVVREWRTAHR